MLHFTLIRGLLALHFSLMTSEEGRDRILRHRSTNLGERQITTFWHERRFQKLCFVAIVFIGQQLLFIAHRAIYKLLSVYVTTLHRVDFYQLEGLS